MLAQIKPYNPGGANAVTVCTLTVRADLCVGCGICVPICPTGTLKMVFDDYGAYIPVDEGRCRAGCHVCVDACPFLDQKQDEDTLAREDFQWVPGIQYHPQCGYYLGLWAGYARPEEARLAGTSGGLARWFLAALLDQSRVDQVVCITNRDDPERLLAFTVLDSSDAVRASAKSAYYPSEMSEAISQVLAREGRYAVVALPCYLKGLKLAMRQNVKLRKRVVLTVGLVCGQTKSKAFAEFLTRLVGVRPASTTRISFREKNLSRPATEFVFEVSGGGKTGRIGWTEGEGWFKQAYVTGMFKPRCCDYCDDVFAELADISFMDAWLPRYHQDGRGTSIVLTRSAEAEGVLAEGRRRGELELEPVSISDVLLSQDSVLPYKRGSLPYRLYLADAQSLPRPQKRVAPRRPPFEEEKKIAAAEGLRRASHALFRQQRRLSEEGLAFYLPAIRSHLWRYRFWLWWIRYPRRYLAAVLRRSVRAGNRILGTRAR